jgi:hypothetical protein
VGKIGKINSKSYKRREIFICFISDSAHLFFFSHSRSTLMTSQLGFAVTRAEPADLTNTYVHLSRDEWQHLLTRAVLYEAGEEELKALKSIDPAEPLVPQLQKINTEITMKNAGLHATIEKRQIEHKEQILLLNQRVSALEQEIVALQQKQ